MIYPSGITRVFQQEVIKSIGLVKERARLQNDYSPKTISIPMKDIGMARLGKVLYRGMSATCKALNVQLIYSPGGRCFNVTICPINTANFIEGQTS